MKHIRNSVKAIIIQNNSLLCIRKIDELGFYYLLPGGGQDKNETFIEAVERECLEELGAPVHVGQLRYIREYIGEHHEFRETDHNHQIEFMFECTLCAEPDPQKASHCDEGQDGIEWVSLDSQTHRVYPKVLLERIRQGYAEVYWGDIN
ncbi:MAG TPA: NUDIX domain-containing protein [Anaerolineaceae bacterium]|nr:NUDIX domain-containing protein [Anaerolineaceae bacterium]HQH84148.1 NUDIX domain-containing protein [Anaerolineaceae bacterium]